MELIKQRLRRLRDEKNKLQVDVANDLHISRGTYASYEGGITPPVDMCIKLASYFNVTVDYLLCVSNERRPAGGALQPMLEKLASYPGIASLTASDLADLLTSALRYQQKGAPCGDLPIKALTGFLDGLRAAMDAAAADDGPALALAANDAVVAALAITKMPAALYQSKEDITP